MIKLDERCCHVSSGQSHFVRYGVWCICISHPYGLFVMCVGEDGKSGGSANTGRGDAAFGGGQLEPQRGPHDRGAASALYVDVFISAQESNGAR